MMLNRQSESLVREKLSHTPAVVLLGPRQVGKTTLAKKIAANWSTPATYLDLERPADKQRLQDADTYLRSKSNQLIILDEIHRAPAIFDILRGIIDERRSKGQTAGQFLLLGSASLDLMQQSSETLAGRVAYLEISPISVTEARANLIESDQVWIRGGFPDSLLATNTKVSLSWRRDFIKSYLERDVPMFAPRLPAETIRRLWTMLAHQQSAMVNQARLAASLGITKPAIDRYINLLVDLQLLRRLKPWSGNVGKRLVKAPKVFVRDSGILHALLELEELDEVISHPVCGSSFEGYCIENLILSAGERRVPYFYRTHTGAEIDLLFEKGGTPEIAIEIKRSMSPSLDRGFALACDELGITKRFVVYPGFESFGLRHGAQALGLATLMQLLEESP
ncbi:MAG: hypothetical protein RL203_78 [Pseudomonadota bacterium]|jgi:predicted AAA+ superfamily ATPase